MRIRAATSTIVIAGIIIAGFVFSLAVNLPGHLSYDSVIQLWEGRTAQYNDWHPPVMAWLLGAFDVAVPGTGLFVVFNTLLGFASFLAVLWLRQRTSWAGAVVAAAAIATPQLLIYEGIVWKDVLFADAGLAGFACLALAAAVWPRRGWRLGLIAVGFALLVLAALARQNGILLLPAGSAALAWIAVRYTPRERLRAGATYAIGSLAVSILAIMLADAALNARVVARTADEQFVRLHVYDVIGALVADPDLDLSELHKSAPLLEEMMRRDGVRIYNPERSDTLLVSPALQSAMLNVPPAAIAAQWRDLIFRHPWLYLRVRADVFRWIFLTPDLRLCVPYYVGIDGPPDEMAELGLTRRSDARDNALDQYAANLMGTPLFSHLFYGALAIGALVLLLRRRRPEDIAIAALLAGTLAYSLSYFVIGVACDYRYLYALDLSAILAIFYLALELPNLPHRR